MNRKTFIRSMAGGVAAIGLGPLAGCAREDSAKMAARPLAFSGEWSGIRDLFPLSRERVYFNTGGLGPPSTPVLEAMREQALLQAESGETYHDLFDRVRERTAGFFGAAPGEIGFTRNASESNSLLAAGLDLKPGDEVIFESHAHPGGSFPWLVQQKEKGIRVRIFEPDSEKPEHNLDRIFNLVNARTRVIQVSHITAPTGILFDVEAIAREARARGIWFHIDGAQSAGMIPVDLRGIACDSYAASGHKWLNGPQESGFLYIARERIDEVACSHAGAYSDSGYELPDQFSYNPAVQRHEYGTRDAASIVGLETAILLQENIGRERIAEHGKKLAGLARTALEGIKGLEILTPRHPKMHNSILTFRLAGHDFKQLANVLTSEYNLRVRNVSERGLNAIRISWHLYNSEADLDELARAVREIAS